MATLAVGQTLVTRTPTLDVDGLPVGTYRFRLEVDDDSGNASRPSDVTVEVVKIDSTPVFTGTILRQPLDLGRLRVPLRTIVNR